MKVWLVIHKTHGVMMAFVAQVDAICEAERNEMDENPAWLPTEPYTTVEVKMVHLYGTGEGQ